MGNGAWRVCGLLLLVQTGLAWYSASRDRGLTYVFTPLVDVVPSALPLDAEESNLLTAETKNKAEARDIQQAYARLGSTFSLDDLLRGVEGLKDLSPTQQQKIATILENARAQRQEVLQVQQELLTVESQLATQVSQIQAQLPAGMQTLPPPGMPPGRPPGPPPGPPPVGQP